jgi:hypothetical protein
VGSFVEAKRLAPGSRKTHEQHMIHSLPGVIADIMRLELS